MNIIEPIIERIRPFFEKQFPGIFQRGKPRSRRVEIQLELPWREKR